MLHARVRETQGARERERESGDECERSLAVEACGETGGKNAVLRGENSTRASGRGETQTGGPFLAR